MRRIDARWQGLLTRGPPDVHVQSKEQSGCVASNVVVDDGLLGVRIETGW